jgi:hypothetical protein
VIAPNHEVRDVTQRRQFGRRSLRKAGGLDRHDGLDALRMRQGYLPGTETASVRVRISGDQARLNIKGATLVGNGPDALTRVTLIGNDMGLDPGVGTCGKEGQSVPVGVGQPTLRIDGLTVGGTA